LPQWTCVVKIQFPNFQIFRFTQLQNLNHSSEYPNTSVKFASGPYLGKLKPSFRKTMATIAQSRFFARLLGPSAIALAVTEALNSHIFAMSSPPVVYLNGTLMFIGGVAIVLNHNVWRLQWPILITLIGWQTAFVGLFRMVKPELALEQVRDGRVPINKVLVPLGLVGAGLCVQGYK
jgi:hypothetical protein